MLFHWLLPRNIGRPQHKTTSMGEVRQFALPQADTDGPLGYPRKPAAPVAGSQNMQQKNAAHWSVAHHSINWVYILLPLLFIVISAPIRAQEVVGVNRVNLAWLPTTQREAVLTQIARAGVRFVRLSLVPPYDASLDDLRAAKAAGLRILLIISLNQRPFYPKDVTPQPASPGLNEAWPLSALDPAAFASLIHPLWQKIVAESLPVAAIELGNEINWGDFNGDFKRHLRGQTDSPNRLDALPERGAYLAGLNKYLDLLGLVRNWRAESPAAAKIQVVTAGLATVPAEFARRIGLDVADPSETLAFLRGHGLAELATYAGLHFYPDAHVRTADRHAALVAALRPCSIDMPCWITEWGVSDPAASCAPEAAEREVIVREVRQDFARMAVEKRIAATFLFDWDGPDPTFAVWRCGKLTPAGRAAFN